MRNGAMLNTTIPAAATARPVVAARRWVSRVVLAAESDMVMKSREDE